MRGDGITDRIDERSGHGAQSVLNVLVVDDSAVVRQAMTSILSRDKGLRVTVAADPYFAMRKMEVERPDVIVLDVLMPRMDGLTFLRKIMSEDPIPVVICSGAAGPGTEAAVKALEEGAVEIVAKPKVGVRDFLEESALLLIDTIRGAAESRLRSRSAAAPAMQRFKTGALVMPGKFSAVVSTDKVVAIGASTGGTEALKMVLEAMPSNAPGIVIVQHMPEGFTAAFANRLNQLCRIHVKEAASGDILKPGMALVAPGNHHISVVRVGGGYAVEVSDGPLVSRHRPSVDVLFHSVAKSVGYNAIGVIMTGMGNDGAEGMSEMKRAGAVTIAQDEASCTVFGMPKEAIARGAVDDVVPLQRISWHILERAGINPLGAL
ncbi:MAG: chemotaxis response regulator protein-glutamate methylesterase [Blastocatellia bacterium AA13]|nr:MAG: chemotaxis response regulator protein-glutamate methylesterase [Blastocatellia bacterium AA13]